MPDLQRSKERLRRRAILAALGACFAILALAATAQAETLTLGPALTGPGSSGYCSIEACDEMLLTTEAPSVEIASPIDGTVVRWRVKGPSATPGYSLNVLRDNGDGTYTVTASTGPVTPAGNEIETLATSLPIHVGEYIELNLPQNGQFTALEGESTYATFFPVLQSGETRAPFNEYKYPYTFGYNADIESESTPAPPGTSAPPAPPTAAPIPEPVAEAHCLVPKLAGKKLKAAKKALTKAECKLGKVKGKKSKSAKVIKQSPKPGAVLPLGTKVNVKLGG